jgi:uncharacterized Tic20 family protein
MTTSNEKNTATLIHLSALTQYIIPFGNYIFPTMIWSAKKNESEFVDYTGKQVLNFQLSILIYSIVICIIAIPILIYAIFNNQSFHSDFGSNHFDFDKFLFGENSIWAILGILGIVILISVKIIEFVLIIYAALKASNGDRYTYPLSIPFFK